MSLTSQNLLDIAEALADKANNATNVDYVIPSPFAFKGKEDFWASINNDNNTKSEIETELINAAWFRYLKFEDDDTEIDGPVRTLIYELTMFTESTFERLDETATPDAFNKQIRKTNHEHVTAIMSLCNEFQGVDAIPALSGFSVAETVSVTQEENSEHEVECQYIPGLIGDQTKLQCRIRVQLPC